MNKRKINLDPTPLDDEERQLREMWDRAIENGTAVSQLTPERQAELIETARNTINPPKERITMRLPKRDLSRLKARALEMGIPYQTLLTSIVHRYVEGTLVEKD